MHADNENLNLRLYLYFFRLSCIAMKMKFGQIFVPYNFFAIRDVKIQRNINNALLMQLEGTIFFFLYIFSLLAANLY